MCSLCALPRIGLVCDKMFVIDILYKSLNLEREFEDTGWLSGVTAQHVMHARTV